MKKACSRLIALILVLTLMISSGVILAVNAAENVIYPTIVIPGIFQSDVNLYDEGNIMLNSDGEEYSKPFYLDTTNEIVELALKEAVMPIASLLITQHDKDERCANAVANVLGEVLMGKVTSDSNGHPIYNVKATKYNTNAANLSEYDRNYILNQIPLNDYVASVGAENLYFLSYFSFGNLLETADELYNLIQTAKAESGKDKVNLVPISQGGSVLDALLQIYKEDDSINFSDDVNRVCCIVPASDGSNIIGDIFRDGLLDDDYELYCKMIPSLMGDDQQWLGYLVNLIFRIMPNADLNNILDKAVNVLVDKYLKNSTCIWGLLPSAHYNDCAQMYLNGEENAVIRAQTDWFYNAQVNVRDNILEAKSEGAEFFDIVDYNYLMYELCDSYDKVNSDGIIQIDSTSFGCTSVATDTCLPEDYVQADTYCTCPGEHNHIDSYNLVDASSGILCESTFYFYGQDHEKTARNDVIIKLATRVLTDSSFSDVYSDPQYPQFNCARDSRALISDVKNWKNYDISTLSAEDAAELSGAIEQAEAVIGNTIVDTDAFKAASDRFYAITDKIVNGEPTVSVKDKINASFMDFLTRYFKWVCDVFYKLFGGKGFSDILLFR